MTRFFPLVLSIVWLTAFGLAFMPLPAYETQFFGLAVMLMGVSALSSFIVNTSSGGLDIPRTPLMIMGLAFWALALVSVVLSAIQAVSFLYFWSFCLLPLSFLTFVLCPDRARLFGHAMRGGSIVLALLIAIVLYQFFMYGEVVWPLANPNMLAAVLSLGFFAALGFLLCASEERDRIFSGVFAALLLFCVVLTRSQAALFALAVAALFLIILCRGRVMSRRKELGLVFVFTLMTVPFLSFVSPNPDAAPFETMMGRMATTDLSLLTRGEIWSAGWMMLKGHLWTGTGIGTFFLYYPEYRGADYYSSSLMAHSDPLQFAIEMGVVAGLLFYGFVALAIIQTWRVVGRLGADDPKRVLILAPFCGLGALIAHAHVSFPFYTPAVLILTGGFLAFWMVQAAPYQTILRCPKYISVGIVVVFFTGLLAFGSLVMSEVMVKRADAALAAFDTQQFGMYVNAANKLSAGQNAKAYSHAADFAIGVMESNRPFLSDEEFQGFAAQARDNLDEAEEKNPRLPVIPARRARMAELVGDEEAMERFLRAALTLDPAYLPARLTLIRLYRRQGKTGDVETLFVEGLVWPYRFPAAGNFYRDAIGVFEKNGDAERQKEAKQKLQKFLHGGGEQSLSTIF